MAFSRCRATREIENGQTGKLHGDGSLTQRVPYADATELAMDILRHGEQVQVAAPASLRTAVRQRLLGAAARYD